jgi:hypothetical protein
VCMRLGVYACVCLPACLHACMRACVKMRDSERERVLPRVRCVCVGQPSLVYLSPGICSGAWGDWARNAEAPFLCRRAAFAKAVAAGLCVALRVEGPGVWSGLWLGEKRYRDPVCLTRGSEIFLAVLASVVAHAAAKKERNARCSFCPSCCAP